MYTDSKGDKVCASPGKCVKCENSQSLSTLEHWLDPDANYKYPFHHASYGYPPKESYKIENKQQYQELYFLNGAMLAKVGDSQVNAAELHGLAQRNLLTELLGCCIGINGAEVWCPRGSKISKAEISNLSQHPYQDVMGEGGWVRGTILDPVQQPVHVYVCSPIVQPKP